jgi:hypothetical protein
MLVVLSWGTSSCSTTTSLQQSPSAHASLGMSPKMVDVCLSAMPSDLSAAEARNTFQIPMEFGPQAIDPVHDVAFGQFGSASEQGIAAIDLHTGKASIVATMSPQAAGAEWMSFSDPWLVWAQVESPSAFGDWTIQLLNTKTGKQRQLGSSRLPDGTVLTGQLAFPVVGKGYVAWSQPTSQSSADLRVYRVDTEELLTIDSGKLSSPVIAGTQLVWGKFDKNGPQPSLRMADVVTLRPVTVPRELAQPMPIGYLAGSPEYLVWTSGQSLLAEELSSGLVSEYAFTRDAVKHVFQFPMLGGHFLVWFTGVTNTVLDLRTGTAFDISLPSSVAVSADEIVVGRTGGSKGQQTKNTSVSWFRIPAPGRLDRCSN